MEGRYSLVALGEPEFARNESLGESGGIGSPDQVPLQRSSRVGHHDQGKNHSMNMVFLKNFSEFCLIFIISGNKASTNLVNFAASALNKSVCNNILDPERHTVRLRTITSCLR